MVASSWSSEPSGESTLSEISLRMRMPRCLIETGHREHHEHDDAYKPSDDGGNIDLVVFGGDLVMSVGRRQVLGCFCLAHRFSTFTVSERRGSASGNSGPLAAARATTRTPSPTGPSSVARSSTLGFAPCTSITGMTSQYKST